MENRQNTRAQQTRERLRAAAHRLFLQQGYLATSIDAILAEAGISSKETLYRHYANKEALFVDVQVVARALLGGLVSYVLTDLLFAGEQAQLPSLDRADALVEVIMRALTP